MEQKNLETQILLESKAIYNLEMEKKIISNLIKDNSIRLKYFRFINKKIIEKVESLEEKIALLEG